MNCPTCLRHYKSKYFYNRHVGVCELLSKGKQELSRDTEERQYTPSVHELYMLVLDLSFKNSKLEEKVAQLTKWKARSIKKMPAIEVITKKYTPECCFSNWIQTLVLDEKHLNNVFENDYIGGIALILEEVVPHNLTTIPLSAICQNNTLYVYEDQWITMKKTHYEQLNKYISKNLMTLFVKWQQNNMHRMKNENFADVYVQNVQKVIGSKYSSDRINASIKKTLYELLKRQIVELNME